MGYSSGLIVFYTSVYVFYGRINAEVSCGHIEPSTLSLLMKYSQHEF